MLLHSRISWTCNCDSLRYCGCHQCCGCGMHPASLRVSSQLNFWDNIMPIFMYFIVICIQIQLNFRTYVIDIYIIYFNRYVTCAICPWYYPLYDIADYWLSAIFCNPQLTTLTRGTFFVDLFTYLLAHKC